MNMRIINRFVLFSLFVLCSALWVFAQASNGVGETAGAGATSYSYKFENPRFLLKVIEVDVDASGAGELRFTRGESDEVLDCKVKLLPPTIARIRELFEVSGFLDAQTDYQDKKDFAHLGWVTLGTRQGVRERKARFNFTTNAQINELKDIFLGIAWQEISLFDIENAERYQPLDLPKQLETLENDLGLSRIAEPARVLEVMKEIAKDDSQPLIARNHAKRISELIQKGKFKSPLKKESIQKGQDKSPQKKDAIQKEQKKSL